MSKAYPKPFYAFPDDVRRIIYTTNAIESLNAKLRRAAILRRDKQDENSASIKVRIAVGL